MKNYKKDKEDKEDTVTIEDCEKQE